MHTHLHIIHIEDYIITFLLVIKKMLRQCRLKITEAQRQKSFALPTRPPTFHLILLSLLTSQNHQKQKSLKLFLHFDSFTCSPPPPPSLCSAVNCILVGGMTFLKHGHCFILDCTREGSASGQHCCSDPLGGNRGILAW